MEPGVDIGQRAPFDVPVLSCLSRTEDLKHPRALPC